MSSKTLYEACVTGKPPALPEPVIQYADYAMWQRERLQWESAGTAGPVLSGPLSRCC